MRSRIFLVLVAAFAVRADVRDCVCDLANPAIAESRTCSLCVEAEKHPASEAAFILKEIARRQCHEHVHIGKLLDGNETGKAIYVDGPSELTVIADSADLWFHPAGNRLHVHAGEQINEAVLMR